MDKIYRYRTDQIQTFDVGLRPDAQSEAARTILWSVAHYTTEINFLVGNRAAGHDQSENADSNDLSRRRRWA